MPLITCPDCNRPISAAAPTCPNCGRPTKAINVAADVSAGLSRFALIVILAFFAAMAAIVIYFRATA